MPKLDLEAIPQINATGYPSPWREEMAKRHYRRLGPVSGLGDFGVSHVTLEPGGVSSQRHWHEEEDEFVVMLEGEAVLVEDAGETVLRPGDVAAWPAGKRDGHHLQNRSAADVVFVVVSAGDRATDQTERMLRDLCEVAPIEWKEKDPADTSPGDRYAAVLEAVGPTGYGRAEVEMHAQHIVTTLKDAYVEEASHG